MKTGACLPRGLRWLGLMALGGVSLAVQAEEKIVLLTSWYAQADRRSTACSCCCRSGPM